MLLWIISLLLLGYGHGQVPSDYQAIADIIIETAKQSIDYDVFEYMCDTFGPRYRGTGLDNALNYILANMGNQGLENVQREPVYNISNWIRGKESLTMLEPRVAELAILGLGKSIGGNVQAEAVVVSSFDELNQLGSRVQGKIVVYNQPFVSYGQTVVYRSTGASAAAKFGAVAALVRTVGSYSLYTPHTGGMDYESGVPQIPAAAITQEDAEMLGRMYARGQTIVLNLQMGASFGPLVTSFNILAEVVGRTFPNEVVLLGGHSDSWDVGQGAIDDGGGMFSAWESLKILKDLITAGKIPRPKRTIRVVLWVDEEVTQRGAQTYADDFKDQLGDHVIAFESDSGNFEPTGFGFTGVPAAKTILQQIGNLMTSIGTNSITDGGVDTDNGFLQPYGVPLGALRSRGSSGPNALYFYFHHSNADTLTHMNKTGMINSVASFAVMTYVLADIGQKLPR